jgi:zinc protease
MVIGYESDLHRISREDLFGHYQRAYRPSNAIIVAAGDFDAEALYGRIEQAFGTIEPGAPLSEVAAAEPKQRGERRVTLRQPAPTSYLRMAYHTPAASSPDTAAILVADAVLSGGKGMGLGGGGQMGRSARLYRSLVASGLARSAGSDFELTIDPYLLIVGVTALPDADPQQIESVIDREMTRLREELVAADELERAVKQVKAQYVYSTEGVTNQAFWLGQMEIVDRYQRAGSLIAEIERVTADDIQRVAATYLILENRTVGWLHPTTEGSAPAGDGTSNDGMQAFHRWGFTTSAAEPAAAIERPPFERTELGNGIVLLGQAQPADPAVSVRIRLHVGAAQDPKDQPGLAAFTARMLMRGTSSHSFEAINQITDGLGATLSVDAGRLFTEASIRCLREDLPRLLELAAEVILTPTFPDEEVDKVRSEILTAIREQDNDTQDAADRALRELLFPVEHPFRHRILGTPDSVSAIQRDDLVAFHRQHFGPAVVAMAVVGGIDSFEQAVAATEKQFGQWSAKVEKPGIATIPEPPKETVMRSTSIPGKSQADIAVGLPTIPRTDPDYYALEMANMVLGRLGLMGRLGATVRDEQGLAYYVYSAIEAGKTGSIWISRAGVDPGNVAKALAGITSEVKRLRAEPVSAEELADAKSYMTGSLPLALEMNSGVASLLLNIEYYALGLDYLDRYPAIINGLTLEQVHSAAKAHLNEDRFAVGIAGPPEE